MTGLSMPENFSGTPFYEMAGSPVEWYTTAGFRAQRNLITLWSQREQLAREIMGSVSPYDYKTATSYPGRPTVMPVRVKIAPLEADTVGRKRMNSLHEGLNAYTLDYAVVTIDYATVSDRDLDFGPENEGGTQLTYRLGYETLEIQLPTTGWVWSDSTAVPADTVLTQRIPQAVHVLVWSQVINPPWDVITSAQGKVNSTTFLDSPPETLLFEGCTANKLYRSNYEDGASAFCWQLEYTFRQRCVHHNGNTYGWNHLYRGDTGTWCIPANSGNPIYENAELNSLFHSN